MDSGFDVRAVYDDSSSSTGAEARLSRLWAEILELDQVDPEENFFLLGGDSLRAATLFALIDTEFGVTIPLGAIYDDGENVIGMAALIDRLAAADADAPAEIAASGLADVFHAPKETRKDAPRDAASVLPLMEKGDLLTAATLMVFALTALLPRRAMAPALCRLIARTHIALRGAQADYLDGVIPLLPEGTSAAALEIGLLADTYEAGANMLRAYAPWTQEQAARLSGRVHIDAALEAGRGAVLWSCPTARDSRAGLRSLADTGLEIVQLRSYAHPFSGSRIGAKFLNPIPNRIDDRYLADTVVVSGERALEAAHELGGHLKANRAVRLSANGAYGTPHEIPFLGGTLRLALGAPTLALLHGAPLIPVFSVPDGAGGIELVAEAPLTDDTSRPVIDRARALAGQYATLLERHVRRHPHLWRCWFMGNTWQAGERPVSGEN